MVQKMTEQTEERRKGYEEIVTDLKKIREENEQQDTRLNNFMIEAKQYDSDVKKEMTEIKNDIGTLRNHLDNGWKNDLVIKVIEATLNLKQTRTTGFWVWVKGAFTAAFFLGMFELIKYIMR